MPALPTSAPLVSRAVDDWRLKLRSIAQACSAAKDTLTVPSLLTCHQVCSTALSHITALRDQGLTVEVLGPMVQASLILPRPWTDYRADYESLRDVDVPALLSWIESQTWTAAGDGTYAALTQQQRDEVSPLLDAVLARVSE